MAADKKSENRRLSTVILRQEVITEQDLFLHWRI